MIPSTSSCPCLTNFPPAWWLFTSSLALFVAFPPSSSISLLCCFQSAKGTPDRLFAFLPCPSPFRVVPACTREYEVLCDKKKHISPSTPAARFSTHRRHRCGRPALWHAAEEQDFPPPGQARLLVSQFCCLPAGASAS